MKSITLLSLFILITIISQAQPCAVLDKWGEVKPVYSSITNKPDTNYFLVWDESGNYGLVSSKNEIIIPTNYDDDIMITGTKAIVKNRNKKLAELWDVKTKTKVKLPGISADDVVGDNGLIAVEAANNKWGYSDSNGKLVLPAKYNYAQKFVDNKAVVMIGEKYGVINEKGVIIIPCKYDELTAVGKSLLLARIEDTKNDNTLFGLIENTSKIIYPINCTDYKLRDGVIELRKPTEKSILYNYSGKQIADEVIIPTAGEKRLYVEDERIVAINTDKKWFVLDTTGRRYLEGKYYFLYNPVDRIIKQVTKTYLFAESPDEDALYGVVKLDGTVILPGIYKDVIAISENRVLAKLPGDDKKYSIYDENGKIVAADVCDKPYDFSRYFLIAKKDGKYGVLNSLTGEVKVPFIYESLNNYNNCYITLANGEVADTYDENFQKLSVK
jgi:WG containing repeat